MSFHKLFIPVDGSENSLHACEMAVRLAETGNESVVLAHCFDSIPQLIQGHALEKLKEDLAEEVKKIFEACLELFAKAKIPAESIVLFGKAGVTLAEAADDHKCDLIIMGTRGMGSIGTMMLGSVSNAVIHNTNLPVMLIPEPRKFD